MSMCVNEVYQEWILQTKRLDVIDPDIINELEEMKDDDEKKNDSFYKCLSFGTGGLRGVIGAGTNRMNVYTVAQASQGLADYINNKYQNGTVAISYDSRIKSDVFAKIAAEVFAANKIKVYMYSELMPTPCLSFAVRKLACSVGVMITASHNPSEYNGYKVYGADGCQITSKAANEIAGEIKKINMFQDIKREDFSQAMAKGMIDYIPEGVYDDFIEAVKKESLLGDICIDKKRSIIYSPLNGTGLKPVLRALKESGFENVIVVKEQELPDGKFPTCPYPNPENKDAMLLGIEYAKENDADIFLATDPDCDRVGVAIKNENGEYTILSGNETGLLLLDYICSRRAALANMPDMPIAIKTIVTSDLSERIAAHYGVHMKNVLTGFKYIGEQLCLLEKQGKQASYIFGLEESCGYLSGAYVRDKDGVGAAFLICEMYAFYASKGYTLWEKLNEIYRSFGYEYSELCSYKFPGEKGFAKMQELMDKFREGLPEIGGRYVERQIDYLSGIDDLPKSNVLKYFLEGNCSVTIRPSGTEPKLKVYLFVSGESYRTAKQIAEELKEDLEKFIII